MSYDPMTLLTFDQFEDLVEWWLAAETDEFELPNNTPTGGGLRVAVDPESGVWITPTP